MQSRPIRSTHKNNHHSLLAFLCTAALLSVAVSAHNVTSGCQGVCLGNITSTPTDHDIKVAAPHGCTCNSCSTSHSVSKDMEAQAQSAEFMDWVTARRRHLHSIPGAYLLQYQACGICCYSQTYLSVVQPSFPVNQTLSRTWPRAVLPGAQHQCLCPFPAGPVGHFIPLSNCEHRHSCDARYGWFNGCYSAWGVRHGFGVWVLCSKPNI